MNTALPENEREKIIGILKDALILTECIYEHRDQIDDVLFESIKETLHGIESRALIVFLSEGVDEMNKLFSPPLRIKFYEEAAHELFRIQRLINEIEGRENVVF